MSRSGGLTRLDAVCSFGAPNLVIMAVLDEETYLSSRVDEQIDWLSRSSKANKRGFLRLRIAEILLGTAITIFSPYATKVDWGPLAIALAGGGIALSGSLLALNRNQENWVRYRSLCEAIKREKYLYITRTSPYCDNGSAFGHFVMAVEALMDEERTGWARQITPQQEEQSSEMHA